MRPGKIDAMNVFKALGTTVVIHALALVTLFVLAFPIEVVTRKADSGLDLELELGSFVASAALYTFGLFTLTGRSMAITPAVVYLVTGVILICAFYYSGIYIIVVPSMVILFLVPAVLWMMLKPKPASSPPSDDL